MRVLVASHQSSLSHDTSPNHPESPERFRAVLRGIEESGLEVEHVESPEILRTELGLVHDPQYVSMIETFCDLGGGALDMDTIVSRGSWQAALTSAGGVVHLVRTLPGYADSFGFAVTRPPGHHALKDRAMGFCVFNNVAIAAKVLRAQGESVAILDWDVHHGNGTQRIVVDDPGILYVSIHQSGFYPFEGSIDDLDVGEAKGTTVNIPLPAGTGGDVYRAAWSDVVMPVVGEFAPDWVLVSAGYDAHVDDPLAGMRLTAADYGWFSSELAAIHPSNRTVFALEGGYDLDAIRSSAAATVRGVAGQQSPDGFLVSLGDSGAALAEAREAVARYWSLRRQTR